MVVEENGKPKAVMLVGKFRFDTQLIVFSRTNRRIKEADYTQSEKKKKIKKVEKKRTGAPTGN